jgi:alkaline phosphatase D
MKIIFLTFTNAFLVIVGLVFLMISPTSIAQNDKSLATFPPPLISTPLDLKTRLTRIGIGSCFAPQLEHGIWNSVLSAEPDLFLFMGDNVYAESESEDLLLPELKNAYRMLGEVKPFIQLLKKSPIMTTWDDHDYGMNDAGASWKARIQAETLYEHVWAVNDERKKHPGVYYARIFGSNGQRVQIIMLDTRFFRSELLSSPPEKREQWGKFAPSEALDKTMLGADQWDWLKSELEKPAELRLIVSSIAIVQDVHNMEGWRTLPAERRKLFNLITKTDAKGVVLLSGDRHFSGIYREQQGVSYPLTEFMSSSMNLPITGSLSDRYHTEPEPRRITEPFMEENFGMLLVDWQKRLLTLQIRDKTGAVVRNSTLNIDLLQPR